MIFIQLICLPFGPQGTTQNEIWIRIQFFSNKIMYLKMVTLEWCPFCADLLMLWISLEASVCPPEMPPVVFNVDSLTHICVSKLTIIGSENDLLPGRHQAIIWTNAGILLIWPLGINFNQILIEINTFSLEKIYLKMSSGKWHPICLSLSVLTSTRMCCEMQCHMQWKGHL